MAKKKTDELCWRGYPLVRSGNIIYYGNITDPFIAMLQIVSTKKVGELDVADKVTVRIQPTGPNSGSSEMLSKRGEKQGLYPALDLAAVWLERALK